MPTLERGPVRIHYEFTGDGFPLVLFAPGGLGSTAQLWRERPGAPGEPLPWIDPTSELSDDFRVIAMDQRNAGASTAPISNTDGWHVYTGDHLALLDHLGLDRVHLMGGCIGSSYCLGLCQAAPERVVSMVLQNPIGLTADNRQRFFAMFDGWAGPLLEQRADVSPDDLTALRSAMFGGDFVFSVEPDFVAGCAVPMLVLSGDDEHHPKAIAEEIARLAPDVELVLEWTSPVHHDATLERIRGFLRRHTPPSQ